MDLRLLAFIHLVAVVDWIKLVSMDAIMRSVVHDIITTKLNKNALCNASRTSRLCFMKNPKPEISVRLTALYTTL